MKDEVLQKALDTDDVAIPRYDIVLPDGTKFENVQLILKNPILAQGTPLNKQNLLSDDTSRAYNLDPGVSTPDSVFNVIRSRDSYCPKVKVNNIIGGSTVRAFSTGVGPGEEYFETETVAPEYGPVILDLPGYAEYYVEAHFSDGTNEMETDVFTINVDTTKMYTADLKYHASHVTLYSWLTPGATIRFKHVTSGIEVIGTMSPSGECTFVAPYTGKYTIKGVYEGVESLEASVTINSSSGIKSTLDLEPYWYHIQVTTPEGAEVVVTGKDFTKSVINTEGFVTIMVPGRGTYVVTARIDGRAEASEIDLTTYTFDSCELLM